MSVLTLFVALSGLLTVFQMGSGQTLRCQDKHLGATNARRFAMSVEYAMTVLSSMQHMCVCIYVYIHINQSINISIYLSLSLSIHIYIYIIYIYIHTYDRRRTPDLSRGARLRHGLLLAAARVGEGDSNNDPYNHTNDTKY